MKVNGVICNFFAMRRGSVVVRSSVAVKVVRWVFVFGGITLHRIVAAYLVQSLGCGYCRDYVHINGNAITRQCDWIHDARDHHIPCFRIWTNTGSIPQARYRQACSKQPKEFGQEVAFLALGATAGIAALCPAFTRAATRRRGRRVYAGAGETRFGSRRLRY